MHLDILGQPHKSNLRLITRLFFSIIILEGLGTLVYLLALPVDPSSKTALIFLRNRLVLIAAALAGTLLFALLFWKCFRDLRWQQRFEQLVIHSHTTIPDLLLGIILVILLGFGIIVLYKPYWILQPNKDSLHCLLPFIAWIILIMLQFSVIWFLTWVDIAIQVNARIMEILLILALFVISFVARANMTGYALPYQNVWDEVVTYPQAMRMLVEPGMKPYSDVPGYGKAAYGDFLTYVTAGGELLGLLNGMRTQAVGSVAQFVAPPPGIASIYFAVDRSGIPLQYPRLVLALINSLTPVFIYLILRKSFKVDPWSSFGAGLIYAIFSRDVIYYSSFILPDALATTLLTGLLLAAFACLNEEKGKPGLYLVCGLLVGLILNVTIRVVAVILVPFLVLSLARNRAQIWVKFGVILLGMVTALIVSSPYTLLDLPGYLNKITGLTWIQDLSLTHRVSNIVFFTQGMFQPGFKSSYINSNIGSSGLGPVVALLVLVGVAKLIRKFPRHTLVMLVFVSVHLYMISAITVRYTRHALVFYPIACIFAGAGLMLLWQASIDLLRKLLTRPSVDAPYTRQSNILWQKAAPALLLCLFLLINLSQVVLTIQYIQRTLNYKTSQAKVAEYLSANLKPGEKVGILDVLPFVEQDLIDRHIPFERISASDSFKTLHEKGLTFVVSTDRFRGDYDAWNGTFLRGAFSSSGTKLIEFNSSSLAYQGYPAGNLYMFVARVP